jgi:hypothetical protein
MIIEGPFDNDLSPVPSLSAAGIRFESDFDGVQRDGDKLYIIGERDMFDFYNAGFKIEFRFK